MGEKLSEYDSSDDLGPVITRTVKKVQKKEALLAEAESREEELRSCGAIAFTSEFIERLVLLFNVPCVAAFCKCALVWAYADGSEEMADLLAAKYVELLERNSAMKKADEASKM